MARPDDRTPGASASPGSTDRGTVPDPEADPVPDPVPVPAADITDAAGWSRVTTTTVGGAAQRLDACLRPLQRGTGDPTLRHLDGIWWRTTRTPVGPALQALRRVGADVSVTCWGEGAEWLAAHAGRLLGEADTADGFDPSAHPLVAEAARRRPWLRLGRTDAVLEALAAAAIEQVVTGKEAFRSQRVLVTRFGDPVGGAAAEPGRPAEGMRVPLSAQQWCAVPGWELLRAGVEERRRRPLVAGALRGRSLERLASDGFPLDVDTALRSLPGVGPWTSAQVRQRALGDPDAWSVGDYHAGGLLTYALTGEQLDDDACEEVLAPFAGHRYRVEVLVLSLGIAPDRHGPRRSLPTHLPG